jgi:chromate transporter
MSAQHTAPPPPAAPARPSLAALLRVFGWIGLSSFGQGRTGYFHEELVRKRRWLTDREFLEGVSISHLLPGPNITNLSVYLGQRFAGGWGALLGTLAIILPGAALIILLGILYFHGVGAAYSGPIGRGIGAAAVGLVVATSWRTGASVLRTRSGAAIAAITFLLFAVAGLNIFLVLAIVAPVSIWLHRRPDRASDGDP